MTKQKRKIMILALVVLLGVPLVVTLVTGSPAEAHSRVVGWE